MTAPRAALYTPAVLALAVELAARPHDPAAPLQGEARSRTCGSVVRLSAHADTTGALFAPGLAVSACAMGQAAAAIFASAAAGRTAAQVSGARRALAQWLDGAGPAPDWPRIEMLAAVRDHPGRHAAVLLPWQAAEEALSALPLAAGAG